MNTEEFKQKITKLDIQRELARISDKEIVPSSPVSPFFLSQSLAAPTLSFIDILPSKELRKWLPDMDEQGKPILENSPLLRDHKGKPCYFTRSESVLLEYLCFLLSQRYKEPITKAYAEAVNNDVPTSELNNLPIPHIWVEIENIAKALLGRGSTKEMAAISKDLISISEREQYVEWLDRDKHPVHATKELIDIKDAISVSPGELKKESKRGRKTKISEEQEEQREYNEEKILVCCNIFFRNRIFYYRANNFFCPIKPQLFTLLRKEPATKKDIFMPLYNELKAQYTQHLFRYLKTPYWELQKAENKKLPQHILTEIIRKAQEKALTYKENFVTIKSRLPLGDNGKPKYSDRGTANRFVKDLEEATNVLKKYGLLKDVKIGTDFALFIFNSKFSEHTDEAVETITAIEQANKAPDIPQEE